MFPPRTEGTAPPDFSSGATPPEASRRLSSCSTAARTRPRCVLITRRSLDLFAATGFGLAESGPPGNAPVDGELFFESVGVLLFFHDGPALRLCRVADFVDKRRSRKAAILTQFETNNLLAGIRESGMVLGLEAPGCAVVAPVVLGHRRRLENRESRQGRDHSFVLGAENSCHALFIPGGFRARQRIDGRAGLTEQRQHRAQGNRVTDRLEGALQQGVPTALKAQVIKGPGAFEFIPTGVG